jgi:hypothetical protein
LGWAALVQYLTILRSQGLKDWQVVFWPSSCSASQPVPQYQLYILYGIRNMIQETSTNTLQSCNNNKRLYLVSLHVKSRPGRILPWLKGIENAWYAIYSNYIEPLLQVPTWRHIQHILVQSGSYVHTRMLSASQLVCDWRFVRDTLITAIRGQVPVRALEATALVSFFLFLL